MELEMNESVCMYVCGWGGVGVCVCVWGGGGGGVLLTRHNTTPPKQPLQTKITEHTPSTLSLTSTPLSLSFPHPFQTVPMMSQNLPYLSVSTLFQLPDTSYICYYHSVLHSILYESKQVLVLWCFTTQATPYIKVIHSTSPPPIHPCPVPWCHNCPVKSPYVPCSNPFN